LVGLGLAVVADDDGGRGVLAIGRLELARLDRGELGRELAVFLP